MNSNELDVVIIPNESSDQPKVERMNGEVFIQAGNYCVAIEEIDTGKNAINQIIPKGEVLLISSLKLAHEKIHSVVVKPHPRHYMGDKNPSTYNFLFEDFCDKFRVISAQDGNEVRQKEMHQIQKIIGEKQKYLFEVQSNPAAMMQIVMDIYSRRIEHKETPSFMSFDGSVNAVEVIESGINQQMIDQLRESSTQIQDLMKIQSNWMLEKQKELQTLLNAILPFSSELASAQRANMEDTDRDIERRKAGIETLELYLGKDVDVYKVKEGKGADPSIKLTIMQERLFADVELSLFYEDATTFDYNKRHVLWDALNENPAFVEQIFPTERCIVLMRSNYKEKDYGNAYTNYARNGENRAVFLLIRNGENIFALFSPISTHLSASRLFPAKDQIERHLYCNRSKINIDIDDLNYSDKLDAIEQEILHFKRFLLLIAGLDHREKLFGDFYPANDGMNFFFPEFQEKYFNFIHDSDGEGMLPTQEEKRPTVGAYFMNSNKRITRGSRVFIDTYKLTEYDFAPSCYSKRNGEIDKVYHPTEHYMMVTVEKDSNGFFVKIPVHKWNNRGERNFEAKAALPRSASERDLLCLDGIYMEDIEFYINSRIHRREFASYIDLFKKVKGYIANQYKGYQPLIDYMYEALAHIKDCELKTDKDKMDAVYQTLGTWFSENNGYPVLDPHSDNKKVYAGLLLQLNFRASPTFRKKYAEYAESAMTNLDGLQPLRLVIDSESKFWLYTSMPNSSRLNALDKNIFVLRHPLKISAKGRVTTKEPKEVLIDQNGTEEYLIHEWDEGALFNNEYHSIAHKSKFRSYAEKQTVLDFLDAAPAYLESFYSGKFTIEQAQNLYDAHHKSTVKEQREYKYANIYARFRLPLFSLNGAIYVLNVHESNELLNYLNEQFDLEDYAFEKYGIYYEPSSQHASTYSRNVSVMEYRLSSYPSNLLGAVYKPSFTFADMFSGDFGYSSLEDRNINTKHEGGGLLSTSMCLIEKDLLGRRSYFDKKPQQTDILKIINADTVYSSFPLEYVANWRDFSFDKAVNNPLLKPDYKPMKVDLVLKSFNDAERDTTLCSTLNIIVEPYDSVVGQEWVSKKNEELKEKYDSKHPYSVSRGVGLIYSFKDAETFALERKKKWDEAFFSDEQKLKNLVDELGFTGVLSEMDIVYEKDGVYIFEKTKEFTSDK